LLNTVAAHHPDWIWLDRTSGFGKGTQLPYIAHLLGAASLVLGDVSDPDL